jgi:D-alanine transfer protein
LVAIPIFIVIIAIIGLNLFLDKKIEVLLREKEISVMGKQCFDVVKDKSALDKTIFSDKDYLFMLGSSELGISVPQNPMDFYPFKDGDYKLTCFGRPFVQSLQHTTYLGGGDLQADQKVVFMLSIQWFEKTNAIKPDYFANNFSEVQFYKFMENPKISEENKKYYAERVYDFLSTAKKYLGEAYYAKLYLDPSVSSEMQKIALKPYYEMKKYVLGTQDKALIYKKLKELPNKKNDPKLRDINWNQEYEKIEKENEKIVSTNQFNLEDKSYNINLKDKIDKHKDEYKNVSIMKSKEMDDYRFFLSVCKDLGIKPYIVVQPVNGWFYDFAGLDKDQRDQWSNAVTKIAQDNNFQVLDLHEYDYKKYFLIDRQHLGKEGWLKVDEGIYKYFKK